MSKRRERREREVLKAFKAKFTHDNPQYVEEHGGQYVQCTACGFLTSVAELVSGGYDFDVLEDGDESCNRRTG